MRCPRCGAQNRADAAVCAKCDEILDPSQFAQEDDDAGDEEGDRTDVGPAPTAVQAAQAARARATAASGAKRPASAPAKSALPSAGRAIPVQEVRRPYLADEPDARPPDPLEEARRSAGELRDLFTSLNLADRVSSGASIAVFALLIFPWRWTKADDDIIGFVAAFPAAFLAAGIVALVYIRVRRANAALAANLQMAQAGVAVMLAGFCGWFLRSVTDEHVLRLSSHAITTVISEPGKAAWLGTGCAIAALFSSLATALGNRRQ